MIVREVKVSMIAELGTSCRMSVLSERKEKKEKKKETDKEGER